MQQYFRHFVFGMSKHRILKYNKRPNNFKGPLKYQPILLSDSKGNYLREFSHIIEEKGYSIEFACRGGSRFLDQYVWLKNNPRRQVNRYGYVTVYCFLGTCDLTLKKRVEYTNSQGRRIRRNYIDLRHSSDAAAVSYIQDQIRKYLAFVSQFPTVKIVFLKIPNYSIQRYNKHLGNENDATFRENDFRLTDRIALCNDYINEVNRSHGVNSPNVKKDLQKDRKVSGDIGSRSSLDFSMYKDGLHPNSDLAYCWMKKIVTHIFVDCK